MCMSDTEKCSHVWGYTGNSVDGDPGCGAQTHCTKCSLTQWDYSKGPNLAFMMQRAYQAFLGSSTYIKIPQDERQKWCDLVKAVIETPQLIVTLQKGDTIHAYPDGVITAMAKKKEVSSLELP